MCAPVIQALAESLAQGSTLCSINRHCRVTSTIVGSYLFLQPNSQHLHSSIVLWGSSLLKMMDCHVIRTLSPESPPSGLLLMAGACLSLAFWYPAAPSRSGFKILEALSL